MEQVTSSVTLELAKARDGASPFDGRASTSFVMG
jgi:hypothetical protein